MQYSIFDSDEILKCLCACYNREKNPGESFQSLADMAWERQTHIAHSHIHSYRIKENLNKRDRVCVIERKERTGKQQPEKRMIIKRKACIIINYIFAKWMRVWQLWAVASIAYILGIERERERKRSRPFRCETNAGCDVKWLQRFCVFYGNIYVYIEMTTAFSCRYALSHSCTYLVLRLRKALSKHILHSDIIVLYVRIKRRTLTLEERVCACAYSVLKT